MTKSIILASLILASTSLMATDTKWFVGAEVSQADINAKLGFNGTATIDGVNYSNLSTSVSDKDTSVGGKVGAILDDKHRVSLNYSKYSPSVEDTTADLTNMTLNYDYLIKEVSGFTPFIGAHVGQSKFEVIGYDDTDLMYGIQGGVLYTITKNIEFEAGLSYSKLSVKPTTPTISGTDGGITLTNASAYLEADDMTKMYAGFNIKF